MSDNTEPVQEEQVETTEAPVMVEAPEAEAPAEESAPVDGTSEGVVEAESEPLAEIEVPVPVVTAQEAKTVGDEELPEPRVPEVQVNESTEAAQVVQPREGDADTVNVHEVYLALDEVITDPSSPLAVQIPDAGRGSLDLPIHALANGLPKFE